MQGNFTCTRIRTRTCSITLHIHKAWRCLRTSIWNYGTIIIVREHIDHEYMNQSYAKKMQYQYHCITQAQKR